MAGARKKSPAKKTPAKKAAKAQPLAAVPDPPASLGEYGREYWLRLSPLLVEAKILTPLHIDSFRVLCEQWQQYRRLSELLDGSESLTFTTDRGYVQEIPEVRLRQVALANLQKLWPKFGLTPEALAKLGKHGGARGKKLTPLEEFAAAKYSD